MDDPLPPRLKAEPIFSVSASGGAELVLQAIGASLEHRGWLAWIGVALLGVVAGIVYALQHALAAKNLAP